MINLNEHEIRDKHERHLRSLNKENFVLVDAQIDKVEEDFSGRLNPSLAEIRRVVAEIRDNEVLEIPTSPVKPKQNSIPESSELTEKVMNLIPEEFRQALEQRSQQAN